MFIQIQKKLKKKKTIKILGLPMQLDVAIWLLVAAILLGIVVAGLSTWINNSKRSSCKAELDQIRTAVLQYEANSDAFAAPTDLTVLQSSWKTSDGTEEIPLLSSTGRWKNGVVDPWGTLYTIDTSGRTITSTGSGSTITISY